MRSVHAVFVSFSVTAFLVVSAFCLEGSGENPREDLPIKVMAAGDPVARIAELPEEVSNGTWRYLDGRNSSYPGGTIAAYHWDVVLNGVLSEVNEPFKPFIFRQLGLYKITLTITTNDSRTATAFTAVYSIPDSDSDSLPDWWEMRSFGNLAQGGGDDFDGDGYTNLQEYASGTNATVKDPGFFAKNWYYFAAAAGVIVVAIVVMYPRLKKKRKADVKKQIAAAIEIEKALEEDK